MDKTLEHDLELTPDWDDLRVLDELLESDRLTQKQRKALSKLLHEYKSDLDISLVKMYDDEC